MKLIRYPGLVAKGVVNSRMTLKRLIDMQGFPPGVLKGVGGLIELFGAIVVTDLDIIGRVGRLKRGNTQRLDNVVSLQMRNRHLNFGATEYK